MKKTILVAAFALATFAAGAQTMTDALLFSTNNYYGTARSTAMGNAMTAVGGDLGSIGINPAGSAVASYSQFVITPGLSISGVSAAYSESSFCDLDPLSSTYKTDGTFGPVNYDRYTRATLPNLGLTVVYDTGNYYGVKAVTFGMLANTTSHFTNLTTAYGRNTISSLAGAFSALAQTNADGFGGRLDPKVFEQTKYDPYLDPYQTQDGDEYYWNWNALAGYDAFLFGDDDNNGMYSAATQNDRKGSTVYDFPLAGALNQGSSYREYGTKSDIIMNMGMNISDRFYLGFNIGIPMMTYRSVESFTESAEAAEFFLSGFQSTTYNSIYNADASGIYAKLGFIALPTDHLRVGAAIQTPASMTVHENYTVDVASLIDGKTITASNVPYGYNDYSLRTPYIVNAGVAYTFGSSALVSIDYEMADYSVMKFSSLYYDPDYDVYLDGGPSDYIIRANTINKLFCGPSHSVRAGAEFKLNPMFSVRAGYNVTTNPTRYYIDEEGYVVDADFYDSNFDFYYYHKAGSDFVSRKHIASPLQAFSLGFGYSSNGSFFADAAAKLTRYPVSCVSPYATYVNLDTDNPTASAMVRSSRNLLDLVLTVGWRF